MKTVSRMVLGLLAALLAAPSAVKAAEVTLPLGDTMTVQSKVLGREMTLVVRLPRGYQESAKRYPVVYMIGSEYRSRFALFASVLDVLLSGDQIPAMILVGLDLPEGNGVLVPRNGEGGTASADRHLAFLRSEVIPQIDAAYRTAPYRLLYGASNSGMFVVYALLSQPESFNAYLASSPMLGWSPELIAEKAKAALVSREPRGRFLYVIYSDDDYSEVTEAVPSFLGLLQEQHPSWLQWQSEVRNNEGHVPALDVPMSLKAVFPDYNPTGQLTSVEQIDAHFAGLSKRYGFPIDTPSAMVFDLGMEHLAARRLEQAFAVFTHAVAAYPQQTRGYVGMGLVHRRRGETKQAREWLLKALAVDPDDAMVKRQLERLEREEKGRSGDG